jgi:D-serine deaminase-like pyridoxal phosphate-dependent protein
MANSSAIEQQDGHFEPKAATELRVGVDIDHGHRGDGLRALQLRERLQHFVTQPAVLAAQDHEAGG